MATGNTTRLGPWPAGMNNRQPDHGLPAGTLRNAVNLDIDNGGHLTRRGGYGKVAGAARAHSGYSCPAGQFFVDGTNLMRLNADDSTSIVCAVSGDPVSYEYFNGTLYFSDGLATRKLANGVVSRWGFDVPPAPYVNRVAGLLAAGRYLAACTYVTQDGIEHGASDVAILDVADNSGIDFYNLPQRAGVSMRLYLSTANGKTLYMVGETSAGSFQAIAEPGSGQALDKQFISPPPAGRIIRQYRGRMYVADGKVLWHSDPYALEHFRLAANFFQFDEDITIVEPVNAGIWVATTNRTVLLWGDTVDALSVKEIVDYGAIFGTGLNDEATGDSYWYSTRGVVKGTQDGQFINMQEANVAAGGGSEGAAILREHNGIKQFIASVHGATVSPLASTSFINMEVIRKAG